MSAPAANAELRRALREVLTPELPLGPPDASQYASDVDMLRVLYDPDNRIHERAERSGAPFVIGRKGSGKTAFVTAPRLRDGVVAVELPSADVYQGVFDVIRAMVARSVTVFPEHSARLWRHLVWCGVLTRLAASATRKPAAAKTASAKNAPAKIVHDFVTSLGNGKVPGSEEGAISAYIRRLHTQIDQTSQLGGLGELLNAVRGNDIAIADAIDAGREMLSAIEPRWVVIVDSLERYAGVVPTDSTHVVERIAFEGLFQFVGKDGTAHDRAFDIRFAFPAELWPLLERVSSNPAKDFHRKVIAQWSAHELICLAGSRLASFAELHDVEGLALRRPEGRLFTTLDYGEARGVLDRLLPTTVRNGIGGPEDPVAYLMRHTQLLPRHLVMIVNAIWDAHRAVDPGALLPVANRAVVDGVRRAETTIVSDILASYRQVHPLAPMCCERVIPNLRMVFAEGELHQAYNRNGIRKETGMEFRDFRQMMVEIGCIGVEMPGAATSRYVTAEFQYTRPGSLYIASESRLCLHPVFAEVYNCLDSTSRLAAGERERTRPIYPYGSDPNAAVDYRDP